MGEGGGEEEEEEEEKAKAGERREDIDAVETFKSLVGDREIAWLEPTKLASENPHSFSKL
tara:strand:- start:31 stop:210 length:180 start_codon:yes stop_codon:yes gene_type:complete